jgi:hypothetical protein
MGLLIFAIILFISNVLGVYYTFKTWYKEDTQGEIPVFVDKLGRIEIDKKELQKSANR